MSILDILQSALDSDDDDDDARKVGAKLDVAQMALLAKSAMAVIGKIGIPKLVELFSKAGLGDAIQSWIGKGPNKKVTGEQVTSALGPKVIGELAKKAGLDQALAAGALAKYLPKAVDLLTPDGEDDEDKVKKTIGGLDLGGVDLSDGIGLDDVGGLLGGLFGKKG
ncbi:MAG: DUF937 domain-containing protein [Spirochaetia bacterium]|nr:DUF937 domain-containing protein [Spirochaetia bacterium]